MAVVKAIECLDTDAKDRPVPGQSVVISHSNSIPVEKPFHTDRKAAGEFVPFTKDSLRKYESLGTNYYYTTKTDPSHTW